MKTSKILAAAAFAAVSFTGMSASAAFIGETIRATAHFPVIPGSTTAGPVDAVVGAGIEFNDGDFTPFFGPSFDFGNSSILITHAATSHSAGTFNGYRFNDVLNSISDIVSVSIVSDSSGFFSGDPSRITWDVDNIFINFASLGFANLTNTQILLDVRFSEVPIPAALPLFGSVIAGWGFLTRRRKNKAA